MSGGYARALADDDRAIDRSWGHGNGPAEPHARDAVE